MAIATTAAKWPGPSRQTCRSTTWSPSFSIVRLTFSRVTSRGQPFVPTDLGQIAREVLSDLEVRVEQTGGRVEIGGLPTLDADATYQLWAKVGDGNAAHMVSLGVLGRDPGITAFNLAATPTMFEVTAEPTAGSDAPGTNVVLRGAVV